MYTYIDYYDGTTREINYYIDDNGYAYNYDNEGGIHKRYEVMIPPSVIEKNKAGELTHDYRDDLSEPSSSEADGQTN